MAHLATFVFNRSIVVVYSCNSDRNHKFPSGKFPIISNSPPASFVPQNSLMTPKKIAVGEGLPAHSAAERWSSLFSTSLRAGLDVWSRKRDFVPSGSLIPHFYFGHACWCWLEPPEQCGHKSSLLWGRSTVVQC